MKWLVTGGAGFIGSHFIDHIKAVAPDDYVVCYDLLTYAGRREHAANADEFIVGDICSPEHVRHVLFELVGVDVVANFAAESHVDNSYRAVSSFTRTNVEGVVLLLEAIRDVCPEALFLQVSTDEVYGDQEWPHGVFSGLDPQNPYAATKAAAEYMVRAYTRSFDIKTIVTRSSNNWGPRQHTEKFIPAALDAKRSGEEMVVHGYDLQRDWLHVSDNVRAIYELVTTQGRGIWNVATDRQHTLREILERIGDVPHRVSPERPGVDRGYWLYSDDTWKTLGWHPQDFMNDTRWDDYVAGAAITSEPVR